MTLQTVKQQIDQRALPSLYLVTGNEPALVQKAHRLFASIIDPAEQEMNQSTYDFAEVGLDPILDDYLSAPFFGDHRLVLVENPTFLTAGSKLTANQEKALQEALDHPVPGNLLILFANEASLDKRKKVTKSILSQAELLDLPALDERQTRQALHQFLDQRRVEISQEAEAELLLRTQASYSKVLAELPKLLAYASQTKTIDLTGVTGLVPKESTAQAFDLADLVLKQKKAEALHLYYDLIKNGEAPLRLNALLLGQFRLLLQVAGSAGSDQSVGSALKVHPYRVKLARQSLRHYRLGQVRTGFLQILQMEIKMKSETVDPLFLFENFMINFR
ncbi:MULTISPECIES: DNA polymerase III subunit delta [Fructobacillus]|uniref:DNA polymerase III subunit delta n=1 Tax=Fructobacillus cardui TaxID=2893170 RepID=A0ABM9MNH7_9LACO|nr:DNA polymerase III subunit delta [Fructobacillus sp. EFB-N1]KMK53249.1 DNA polymerase III subunit delta [Fructobacillus sp. EFB-N1]CAK1228668.1 DNA polymerase III [Fructobacillus cardui]CAK1230171.1 DNA polymerase III [Fructobacillus cardui]